MCGIAGFLTDESRTTSESRRRVLTEMTAAVAHRGPDSEGHWTDADAGVALGHRRLAILDLSEAGAQPMTSTAGRYVIVFNGEIYNFARLRADLAAAGHDSGWRGHSDTEVLLRGFDVWGIKGTLQRAVGMFAFAAWDRRERSLTLARDRLGEKPLYYGWQGTGPGAVFLFGSELKALRAHPAFGGRIDRDSLCLFVRYGHVPGVRSIYEGIAKLLPGTLVSVSADAPGLVHDDYWSVGEATARGASDPFRGSSEEAIDELDGLLSNAIQQQMVADVPLGAFLSGGVDSSTVVALMQKQSMRPVRTFTIGFEDPTHDEASHARAVARHLGTDHTELYVTPEQARSVIPRLPSLYDEPFADSSQIPTYLVSRLARTQVTVALTGDAGDELFAGYNRHVFVGSAWPKLRVVPHALRRGAARALLLVPPDRWDSLAARTPGSRRWAHLGDKVHKSVAALESRSLGDFYLRLVTQWEDPASVVSGGAEPNGTPGRYRPDTRLGDVENVMAWDMCSYLPNDILTKVDRAAMGVSLETRVPFLDHRVVELAWRLPLEYKLRREGRRYESKWVVRRLLDRYVPRSLVERPKMGFAMPIGRWLRGPLRDWAEDLLCPQRLAREGYLEAGPIRARWSEHVEGRRNWQDHLWTILMFQSWLADTHG